MRTATPRSAERFDQRDVAVRQVSDAVWAFWDMLPTACALAGTATPEGLDGVNVLPTLMEGTPPKRDLLYWEFHEGGFAQAVLQGDWKLVRQKPKFDFQLFDIARDAGERRNLAREQPELVARLKKAMEGARTPHPSFPVHP